MDTNHFAQPTIWISAAVWYFLRQTDCNWFSHPSWLSRLIRCIIRRYGHFYSPVLYRSHWRHTVGQLIWSPQMLVDTQPSLNLSWLFGWHCPAFFLLQWPMCGHAVTHSAVPLPAQPMSVCICACGCACACLCVCEGEIYLPSTRGSICGVCAVGKRLSLWLFSLYE